MPSPFSPPSCFALYVLCCTQAQALEIREYSATAHDRFVDFTDSDEISNNSSFIHNAYDLTGLGWDSSNVTRGLTMVSPIHFVCANHFQPSDEVEFLTLGNTLIEKTVSSGTVIANSDGENSDLYLGSLTEALDNDGISFHPYHNTNYLNSSIIVMGNDGSLSTGPRGASGEISLEIEVTASSANTSQSIAWLYEDSGSDDDCYVETGDSSSPVFIDNSGTAAIIGVNLAAGNISSTSDDGTTTSTTASFATLLPFYANEVNEKMALDGYHLTKANPGRTTLRLTRAMSTETIRAGYDFTVTLDIENVETRGPGSSNQTADNVKLENSFSTTTTVTNTTGTDWFDDSGTSTKARRAFIDIDETVSYSMTLNISASGTTAQDITYYADQFDSVTESFDIEVIESFVSWADGLTDRSSTGDDDLDGISNLLEYAFGGDPETPSQKLSDSTTSILPVYDGDTLTYITLTDASERGLTYTVMTSTELSDDWVDASSYITEEPPVAIDTALESITVNITPTDEKRFFRIEVTLDES